MTVQVYRVDTRKGEFSERIVMTTLKRFKYVPDRGARRCDSARDGVAWTARRKRSRTQCNGAASRVCACSARAGPTRLHIKHHYLMRLR